MKIFRVFVFGTGIGVLAGLVCFIAVSTNGSGVPSGALRIGTGQGSSVPTQNPKPKTQTPASDIASSQDLLSSAFSAKETWSVPSGARVLLVPHHLVAAKQIASLLSSVPAPRRVILLTPDHLGVGKGIVTVGDSAISIDGGTVQGDAEIAARISSSAAGSVIDTPSISKELAMQALLPFVRKAWPEAEVVPVIVRKSSGVVEPVPSAPEGSQVVASAGPTPDATTPDATKGGQGVRLGLSQEISKILLDDPEAILVASVDFSHYLPADVADFHDEMAMDVVASLADREADRVELDNPVVLAVALRTARDFGLGNATIHAHTNSLRILQSKLSNESTSHLVASFAPGAIRDQETTSILFLGDVMLDREVRTRMSRSKAKDYPFDRIKGQEGRFFEGQDLVVANLEGPVTKTKRSPEKTIDFAFDPSVVPLLKNVGIDAVSQANNHALDQGRAGADDSRALLRKGDIAVFGDQTKDEAAYAMTVTKARGRDVALLGFNDSDRPVDREKAGAAIRAAKANADRVVVTVHWGNEYQAKPNKRQTDLARWFVDQGVDAVIGGHPHWMQSVEVYKNRPIAYSLGNFVFDQDWSTETRFGLAVGLVFGATESDFYLFPIRIDKSQPVLLTGGDRAARLDRLASISDPVLSNGIKSGRIGVKR